MANNTTGMSDFEKYPKYQLDKHGKVIKQILNTAESVFGMNSETPIIKQKVGGGQYIVNAGGNPAIFTDDFTTAVDEGKITIEAIGHAVAIANYADADTIKGLFNTSEGDDEDPEDPVLTPEPTPAAKFINTDTICVYQTDADGNITANKSPETFVYAVTSASAGMPQTQEQYLVNELTLSELANTNLVLQKISVILPGDNTTTVDSEPATLYRVFLGQPQYMQLTPDVDTQVKYRLRVPTDLIEPQIFANEDLNVVFKYRIDSCDYTTGVISSGIESTFTNAIDVTLNFGEILHTWIEGSTSDTGTVFNNENTRIMPSVPLSFKHLDKLDAPTLIFNPVSKEVTAEHHDLPTAPVKTPRKFVYRFKTFNEDTLGPEVAVNTEDFKIILHNIGDTIFVKSVADFYVDSFYTPYCYTNIVPIHTPEVDWLASSITEAVPYTPTEEDWYSQS